MNVIDKKICTGCLACIHLCPVGAITIIEDLDGFKYPKIDSSKCVNCGKCRNSCITNTRKINHKKKSIKLLGIKIKNEEERLTSRSGGVFVALSNYILSKNGVIYGCQLGENLEVHHSRATNSEEIKKFKGSKYVKSNLKNIYIQVKKDLENGIKVLFSGTPCEIAGLYTFLKDINKNNLYTCDIICHGTPTPLVYKDFIKFMEKTENSKIINIDFRDKKFGWASHKETLFFNNKNQISTTYYTELFYSHYTLRPSCFNCKYSNMDRISDITIGDFWGIDKENKNFDDNKGVSLVIINNEKGEELLNQILPDINFINVDIDSPNYLQSNLIKPSTQPKDIENFWKEYREKEFEYILKKYTQYEKK